MDNQQENKNKKSYGETKNFLQSKILLFFGLILINLAWIISFFYASLLFPAFFSSLALSLLMAIFFFYRDKKTAENIQNIKDTFKEYAEKKILDCEKSIEHEQQLEKYNEQLKKTNQEFQETTKKLFERETELTKANKRLQEIDDVKSEFVTVAAHQLRTPLTGIKWSYTALLEKDTGPLNNNQKAIVEQGLETIDYAISVINDLLNTARLEEGKTGFNFTVQAIGPVIEQIIDQHKAVLEEKKINLVVDVPLSSSFSFKFDKERMAIVFDNILANAVKYTPPEGKISIKSFRGEKDIQFKITDTGIGIPKKDLDKVFSKFFRSKNAVGFQTSGSGLGLYVAKNIAEKHGGTIEIESEENKGTTFTITLPIA